MKKTSNKKTRHSFVYFNLIVALIFTLSSCSVFLLKISGDLRNPKLEDDTSIKKYCETWKDPYDALWMPDNKDNFSQIIKKFNGIPQMLIFNRNNALLKTAYGEDCHYMAETFFTDSLALDDRKQTDSSFHFLKNKCRIVDKKSEPDHYDYTVVYIWGKFAPKLSREMFESLAEIKKSGKFKIMYISLNKDWQKDQHTTAPRLNNKTLETNKEPEQ